MSDPYTMVSESRVFGGGLNIGALAGRIANEGNHVPALVRPVRDSVQPYITPGESASLDQLLTDMGMLTSGTPAPSPTPTPAPTPTPSPAPTPGTPVLIVPFSTTPSDAGALVFPPADAPMEEKIPFYTSQAYYDYMAARAQATAPYAGGIDQIFDSYVLNSVLSYQGNSNLFGAIGYIQQINLFQRQQLTWSAQQQAAANGYEFTAAEIQMLLAGGSLAVLPSPDNPAVMLTLDRILYGDEMVVTAPQIVPPTNLTIPGIVTMTSQGIAFVPAAMGAGQPLPDVDTSTFRPLSAAEKTKIQAIFGTTVKLDQVNVVFGTGGNAVASAAFANGNPAITWGNSIYLNMTPRDMSIGSNLSMLAHEMTHVRQYQMWGMTYVITTIAAQASYYGADNSYHYYERSNIFANETLEGQARIVEDYVRYRELGQLPLYGGYFNVTEAGLSNWAIGSGVYDRGWAYP